MSIPKSAQTEAQQSLLKLLTPGQAVTCVVTDVARSGMSRRIRLFIASDGEVREVTGKVGNALGWRWNARGVMVSGAGMDMCFHTVYTLASVLFSDGYALNAR